MVRLLGTVNCELRRLNTTLHILNQTVFMMRILQSCYFDKVYIIVYYLEQHIRKDKYKLVNQDLKQRIYELKFLQLQMSFHYSKTSISQKFTDENTKLVIGILYQTILLLTKRGSVRRDILLDVLVKTKKRKEKKVEIIKPGKERNSV